MLKQITITTESPFDQPPLMVVDVIKRKKDFLVLAGPMENPIVWKGQLYDNKSIVIEPHFTIPSNETIVDMQIYHKTTNKWRIETREDRTLHSYFIGEDISRISCTPKWGEYCFFTEHAAFTTDYTIETKTKTIHIKEEKYEQVFDYEAETKYTHDGYLFYKDRENDKYCTVMGDGYMGELPLPKLPDRVYYDVAVQIERGKGFYLTDLENGRVYIIPKYPKYASPNDKFVHTEPIKGEKTLTMGFVETKPYQFRIFVFNRESCELTKQIIIDYPEFPYENTEMIETNKHYIIYNHDRHKLSYYAVEKKAKRKTVKRGEIDISDMFFGEFDILDYQEHDNKRTIIFKTRITNTEDNTETNIYIYEH